MDLTRATHEQISEYKKFWLPSGYKVKVNSDLDVKGKDWCRHNLDRWMWSMKAFSDAQSHTFIFEHETDARDFASDLGVESN